MRVENKRIFISDLPETVTPDELKNSIKNYGNVTSVEIKERKELGVKNYSLFFAYLNVEIDDRNLQQCFKDFADGKLLGQRIILQIARESFLDRLKREREETSGSQKTVNVVDSSNTEQHKVKSNLNNNLKQEDKKFNNLKQESKKFNNLKLESKKIKESTSEDSDSSTSEDEEKEIIKGPKKSSKNNLTTNEKTEDTSEILDLVIKSNKGKTIDRNGLKIESVGKSPIFKIDKSKPKPVINSSEANLKRLQSINNLKKAHKTQKSLIQQALSKIDNSSSKKIIFDESGNENATDSNRTNKNSKRPLFDEEFQEDDFEPNFEIKEQFQGAKGQKLLELQSKYKNDKRFVLDSRFLEENGDQEEEYNENYLEDNEELSLEEEKKKEYEILGQVLGKKVIPKHKMEATSQKKVMLRFDPTQPEHSKFELKNEVKKVKKKRKGENSETDLSNEKKQEEKEVPEVSKEIFYKVTEDLKDSLKEKQEFSLLSMFGKTDEKEQDAEEEEVAKQISVTKSTNNFVKEKNPFRYDSSDDEDETHDIPNTEAAQKTQNSLEAAQPRPNARNTFWSEPFFFTDDDYRFQEGVDFVEKMCSKEDGDFTKLRRDLKEIVKAKVRNIQRKNRPFRKKLGGSRKKKVLRMKRALKR